MVVQKFENELNTSSPAETQSLAEHLAAQMQPGDILALEGNLAAGKTTFTQGFTHYFQIEEYAASPTFTYMNEYHAGGVTILHIDAYRLKSGAELVGMGFWEYMESGVIALIEWADIVSDILPDDCIRIIFKGGGAHPNDRNISIQSPRALTIS